MTLRISDAADRPALTRLRATLEKVIRSWCDESGLLEVFAPAIVQSPGMEPHLRAFEVRAVEAADHCGYLHTSPEYAIKSWLGHFDCDVFSLGRVFRDEPAGRMHWPEFTMLEWYRVDSDYEALMKDVESLFCTVCRAFGATDAVVLPAAGASISLHAPFERITWSDAMLRHAGVVDDSDPDQLRAALARAGIKADRSWDAATLRSMVWCEVIEPHLGAPTPTFLTEFPARDAALARISEANPAVAERFEFYVRGSWERGLGVDAAGGIELANAFSELVDSTEQRQRFLAEEQLRRDRGLPVYPMPEAMLAGLDAMKPSAGIALGVDRLAVWLAEAFLGIRASVRDFYLVT